MAKERRSTWTRLARGSNRHTMAASRERVGSTRTATIAASAAIESLNAVFLTMRRSKGRAKGHGKREEGSTSWMRKEMLVTARGQQANRGALLRRHGGSSYFDAGFADQSSAAEIFTADFL